MRRETFFEIFDQLADASNAVAKMRQLVLQLAFSGGLSGKGSTGDGVPEGWVRRTIESIASSITPGFACSRSHQVEGGHVHLRTHNISILGTLNFDLLVRIDPKMVDPQKASIRKGDILFNNTNSQELVGKTSLVDRDYGYGFSNHITRIRLKDDVVPGFVVFYLTLLRNSGRFARLCTRWINQAAVNTETLKRETILVPPVSEQKRIVAKVDELMALCDRLEAQQQERETRRAELARASLARFADAPTSANLNFLFHDSYTIEPADLRKSILTLAVQGKLVSQDAIDEPVSELLIRELAKKLLRTRGKGRNENPLEAIKTGKEMPELPAGWEWCKIDQLVHSLRDDLRTGPFGSSLHKHDHKPVGVPVWGIESIGKGGSFTGLNKIFVDANKARELASFTVKTGDIIISRSGTVGELCRIPDGAPTGLMSTNLMKISLNERVTTPDYFCLLFKGATSINTQLSELCFGSTRLFLTQKILTKLLFPIPPLAEQRRIVTKVRQLTALVDQLEAQLVASRVTAEKLTEAVVGELTAQN